MIRPAVMLVVLSFVLAFVPVAASAHSHDGSRTTFFSDAVVSADETIHGDLNVVFGNATIAGHVTGNVNVIGGACRVVESGTVDGDEHCLWNDASAAVAPIGAFSTGTNEIAQTERRLFVKLASSAVVVLMFLLFPVRMRLALDRVERHPGLTAAVGVGTIVAVVPVAVLLIVSLVGIPLIVLEVAAIFGGVWLGTGAVALLVGRRLCELVMPRLTPSPLAALLLGLTVVSAAEITPLVGWAVTAMVWLMGIGAATLAFVRSGSGLRFRAAVERRPPVGGPPMTVTR